MSVSKELWSAKVKECDDWKEKYVEAMGENDKLKERAYWIDKVTDEAKSFSQRMYEQEIEKLKEENVKLNFQVDAIDEQATHFCLLKGKLNEENKELKEENVKLTCWLATAHENADANIHNESAGLIIQENDKLREEIDELKEALEISEYYQSGVLERICKLMPENDSAADIIGDVCDYIEKLKEECDDLQKEKFCLGFDEDVHEIVDKKYIKKLKGYLAEVGEDYDARDEGTGETQYGDWFNKVTNNECL
tara:strand:+ start:333 stop:1085 length:753 start_codon:yes stop_codon:yes gene_type:complete